MSKLKIVPMSERKNQSIPVDRVVVINSRNRDKKQFEENVRSIDETGLRKPIVVNGRNFKKTGNYELVCGEGRLLAYKQLGHAEIQAEVIDCDRKKALLFSLIENIARVPPGTMWFAQEMKRLHDQGLTFAEIGRIVGQAQTYVSNYIRLVEQGEDRLIEGVEQGLFSMSFAIQVAQSDDATVQNVLMDAFDDGLVNCNTIIRVRKLIELRLNRGKGKDKRAPRKKNGYTIGDLKKDITKKTRENEDFVRETTRKENRLFTLLFGLNTAWEDEGFEPMLKRAGISERPKLLGNYDCLAT